MSEQNFYETLGLDDASSFEEVQAARQRLLQEHADDPQRRERIEAAYDAILMERLRMRQEGKIKVPDRIRFAEKQADVSAAPLQDSLPAGKPPAWLQDWLDTPSRADVLWPSALFLALSVLSWFSATPDGSGTSVVLGFGVALCIYFINRKERRFWRAVLMAAGGLLLGLLLGFAVVSLVAAQGGALSAAQVSAIATIITLVLLWFISSFLR